MYKIEHKTQKNRENRYEYNNRYYAMYKYWDFNIKWTNFVFIENAMNITDYIIQEHLSRHIYILTSENLKIVIFEVKLLLTDKYICINILASDIFDLLWIWHAMSRSDTKVNTCKCNLCWPFKILLFGWLIKNVLCKQYEDNRLFWELHQIWQRRSRFVM